MASPQIKINAQIDIHATVEQVWQCLTDINNFPDWNPFIRSAKGNLQVGQILSMRLQIPGGPPMLIRPQLLAVDPPHKICWLGSLLLPGVFDGHHQFSIETLDSETTRITQQEIFSGFLVPFIGGMVSRGALRGFEAMNLAMKARLETG